MTGLIVVVGHEGPVSRVVFGQYGRHQKLGVGKIVVEREQWPVIWVVPLEKMALMTEEKQLVRTTLYVISPALEKLEKVGRSGLYNPEHNHLFRGKHNRKN